MSLKRPKGTECISVKVDAANIMALLQRLVKSPACRNLVSSIQRYSKATGISNKRYPHLKRGNYAKLSGSDVSFFEKLLPGAGRVLSDKDELDGYNQDWLGVAKGDSSIVLRPKTTAEVSEILRYCNSKQLAVCPQGGNTSLVGGSVPVFDEVIVSSQLMKDIISVDDTSGILVCQSGCVLEQLDGYLGDYNLMMPLDLGAKGSCQIGGNVSTNAGGIRLLRYGSLHGSVLGVEAVLANGEVIECLSTLRKDNTGYDLKQLFIGSEGTLGFITAVSILCPQKPNAVNVALLGCESFQHVLDTLKPARSMLGEILSAYEFFDAGCTDCTRNNLQLANPISDCPFYILVETSGSNATHDDEKLNAFLEMAMEKGLVVDGTIATETSKQKSIWGLRERIAEALLVDGYCYKYDISLPLNKFYNVVEELRERLGSSAIRVVGYGHVGDGNLHLNITSSEYSPEVLGLIEPFVYEYTSKHKGSISAEHGLGIVKNRYMHYSQSQRAIQTMRQLKNMFDPNAILNPYKTLPPLE